MKSEKFIATVVWFVLLLAAGCGGDVAKPEVEAESGIATTDPPAATEPAGTENAVAGGTAREQPAVTETEAPSVSDYMSKVQRLSRAGQLDEAETTLSEAIGRYPEDKT